MMNFKQWCALDVEDDRKINYEILKDGKVLHLTSEDYVSHSMMRFIQESTIQFLKLFNNQWYVILR